VEEKLMGKDNNFHSKIHFRRLREIASEIARNEGVSEYDYDFFNMKVYETFGENLKGKNVSYDIVGSRSCWVKDNKYVMVEVPSKRNNKKSPYGDFLFLALNNSFGYYLFGKMSANIDIQKSRQRKQLVESVHFEPFGRYEITFESYENNIVKVQTGYSFEPGLGSDSQTFNFDTYNVRKKTYGTSKEDLLKIMGINNFGSSKFIGQKDVQVYRKNNYKRLN
jgi:hypothetical protein